MSKKLIGSHNVAEFICANDNTIRVDSGMILAPGTKDVLRSKGVQIVYEKRSVKLESPTKDKLQGKTEKDDTSSLIEIVVLMLRKDFGVVDEDQIRDISVLVMEKIVTKSLLTNVIQKRD